MCFQSVLGICCESSTTNWAISRKQKHIVLSLEKKLEAVKCLDQGETPSKVASELDVGKATVWDWKKRREDFVKCSQRSMGMGSSNVHRKTIEKGEFEKTSEALYMWFLEMKEKGVLVSGLLLKHKALELQKKFNEGEEFTCSKNWLKYWKKRYGIGDKLDTAGEKVFVDSEETCIVKEKTIVNEENLSLDESHTCDETAVHNCMCPEISPVIGEENVSTELKQKNNNFSILDYSDVSGENTLKLLLL